MVFMCENRVQPILTTLTTAVVVFGIHPSVYHIDNNFKNLLQGLTAVICTFILCLVVPLQMTYIATIRGKMRKLMIENFTLFNKMHEGLVVIRPND